MSVCVCPGENSHLFRTNFLLGLVPCNNSAAGTKRACKALPNEALCNSPRPRKRKLITSVYLHNLESQPVMDKQFFRSVCVCPGAPKASKTILES